MACRNQGLKGLAATKGLATLREQSFLSWKRPTLDLGVGTAGLIRRGQWTKVPTIIGGQSCESCGSALGAFGFPNPDKPISKAEFDAALVKSGFDGVRRLPSGANASGEPQC